MRELSIHNLAENAVQQLQNMGLSEATLTFYQKESFKLIIRFFEERGVLYYSSDVMREFSGGIKVHPHMLRHTRAMHLYRGGMPLSLISEWLGHAQLETTMIYAYADTEMKRTAIQKATAPLNPLKTPFNPNTPMGTDLIRSLYGLK